MASFTSPAVSDSNKNKLTFIEEITKNAEEVQQQILAEILSQNAETEYLQRYGLGGATDHISYKKKIPVVSYEDIQPDIQRIANGDRSPILTAHPIMEFNISSGTSGGKRKLIPVIEKDKHSRLSFLGLSQAITNQYASGLDLKNALNFVVLTVEIQTPGGYLARTADNSVHKSWIHNTCSGTEINASPVAILSPDYFTSMYIQMLCAIYRRLRVSHIQALYASGLLRCFDFLNHNWPQLVHDISTGTLTKEITDQPARDSVSDLLRPDLELAAFITDQCSRSDWSGIVTRIWPQAKFLQTIVTGPMSQYIEMLQFYAGGLPLISMDYVSTECFYGINLNPLCNPFEVSYTLLPNMAYYEFIPLEPENGIEIVDLVNVRPGREYELVITTLAGLYRYKVGDILRAAGFYHAAPHFNFVRRKNVVLSVHTDKTDETDLQRAVESATRELLRPHGTRVVEYTGYVDVKVVPGHYVVYLELAMLEKDEGTHLPSNEVLKKCCLVMEEALGVVYRQFRATQGPIGPLEIRVVTVGTFEEAMKFAMSQGTSLNQYKVPKSVKDGPILELLNSRVASAHFSPVCPKWNPHQSI